MAEKIFEIKLELFIKYGLNRQIMMLVGFVELFGAIALWIDGLIGVTGMSAIAGTSVGAIFFHLRFDTWKDGVPAMLTLFLSSILLFITSKGLFF